MNSIFINDYDFEVAAAAALLLVLFQLVPSARLLTKTVYREASFAWVRGVARAGGFMIYIKPRTIFRATCLWIEAELLDPRPKRPERFEFGNDRKYRETCEDYRSELGAWRRSARERLSELLDDTASTRAIIPVETCFDLYKAEEGIRRYFDARGTRYRKLGVDAYTFVSMVEVAEGFIAPLHLITGLYSHFDEDWRPIIRAYGRTFGRTDDPMKASIRGLQLFLFDCWLMWGPSIPIGTCDRWKGVKLVQFGYGDENNSISLLNRDAAGADNAFLPPRTDNGGNAPMARRARVRGRLAWIPAVAHPDICPAQQPVFNRNGGQLVLQETDMRPAGGTAEQVARRYYSAYIWVCFVLCDLEGSPLHRAEPWRNMVTFFEHGNLAEDYTYDALKAHLITKSCLSIERMLDAEKDISLRYGCAIDDCGCGAPIEWPPPPGEAIGELMRKEERFIRLRDAGRLSLEPPKGSHGVYSACGLPPLLDGYLDSLEIADAADKLAAEKRAAGKRLAAEKLAAADLAVADEVAQ
ncbi:MAG TPA: hypothetical protein VGL06_21235 [Pseudonocardiaceae bacterium]